MLWAPACRRRFFAIPRAGPPAFYRSHPHEPVPFRGHRQQLHPAVPYFRAGTRHPGGARLRRRPHHRRLLGRLPHSQPVAPAVRRRRLRPGLRADPGPCPQQPLRNRGPRPAGPGGAAADRGPDGDHADRHHRRALGGVGHGQRPARRRARHRIRRRRLDDAGDVSLHLLHVADCVRLRRAQHLAALCRAGLHASAAEPVHDRRLPLAGPAHGRAGLCPGHRRDDRRRGATGGAMGGAGAAGPDAALLAALSRSLGRPHGAAHPQADGAGHAGRVGGADFAADQHQHRHLARARQRHLAVVRRPPDGIPDRPAGRGAGHGAAAEPVGRPRPRRPWRLQRAARLGPAAGAAAGTAGGGGHGAAVGRPGGDALPLWRVLGAGCAADPAGRDFLFGRPDRPAGGEDPGARLLCQAGHPHARENRHRRTDPDPTDEPGAGAAAGPRRPGARHRPGRLPECAGAADRPAPPGRLPARRRLGPLLPAPGAGLGGPGRAAAIRRWSY